MTDAKTAALKALDDFWTADFPGGPDDLNAPGSAMILGGLGTISDECLAIWRQVRAALASSPAPVAILQRLVDASAALVVKAVRSPDEAAGLEEWTAAVTDARALLAAAPPSPEGARAAIANALELIEDAIKRCALVANQRRKIGPIATQAQTAGSGLATARNHLRAALAREGE